MNLHPATYRILCFGDSNTWGRRGDVLKPHTKFSGAAEKSAALGPVLEAIATKHQCSYLNLATLVAAGDSDGVHLDPPAHQVVAEQFAQQISALLPQN